MSRLTSNAKQLTEQRKGRSRKPPAELASQSDLSQYDVKNNYPALHSASVPGITCLDVHDNIMVSFFEQMSHLENSVKILKWNFRAHSSLIVSSKSRFSLFIIKNSKF